jgi:hypothetical protein
MLRSKLLSDEFKRILRRIVEIDKILLEGEGGGIEQLSNQKIMKMLGGWYDQPTSDDFRIGD